MGGVVSGSGALWGYLIDEQGEGAVSWVPNDLDVLVPHTSSSKVLKALPAGHTSVKDVMCQNYGSKRLQEVVECIITHEDTNTQYMVLRAGVSTEAAIEAYDLTVCMVSWTPRGGFKLHGGASPLSKELVVTSGTLEGSDVWDWMRTLNRIAKYNARGWCMEDTHRCKVMEAVKAASKDELDRAVNASASCMTALGRMQSM